MGKGIIIKESLPIYVNAVLDEYVVKNYPHLLGGNEQVTILKLEIGFDNFLKISSLISDHLVNALYYANFIFDKRMYVIFQNAMLSIDEGNMEQVNLCKNVGILKGINSELMKFDKMFKVDHPNG